MDNNDIKVSVFCTVYNHEKFLRKCLDGFVMQKTNFAFEVLVNDDKSTDSSAEIIREYCEKYPNIFVPVFQTENQYSKGVKIDEAVLYPMAKGKYFAMCEGDDYWCDKNKLQRQYDYMESDPECIMCLHNTLFHYLGSSYKDKLFNNWKTVHIMTADEVFLEWCVHTSSYFIRRENFGVPDFGRNCWAGDMVMRTWLYTVGKLVVLPQVMSVYNSGVQTGAVKKRHDSIENTLKNDLQFIDYFEKLNEATDFKFSDIINQSIQQQNFNIWLSLKTESIQNSINKKEIISIAKEIVAHEYYPRLIKSKHGLRRLNAILKYEGYKFYPIWKKVYYPHCNRNNDDDRTG